MASPSSRPQPQSEPSAEPPVGAAPVELRVHGVSGTPAEEILDRHIIGQVAGDSGAGFFRPRSEYGATHGPGGARLEAYRWGNLTAGAAARAFWLLLLPFSLANMPMWMRPPATGAGRRLVHGLSRIFALTMSATLTLAAVGIFLDLIAWQCAEPTSACRSSNSGLGWFFTGYFAPTNRRLALATIGPIVLVALLWFLARRTWARYEAYGLPDRNPDGDGLADPTFWSGRDQVGRLRDLHIAFMFTVIDAVLLGVLITHDRATDGLGPQSAISADRLATIGVVLASVAGAIGLATLILLLIPPVVDRNSTSRGAEAATAGVRWLALLLTVGTLAFAVVPRADWHSVGPLPGYAAIVTDLFALQAALLALLLLITAVQRRLCPDALLGGFGAPIVASIGLGSGAALSAGVSYRVADLLDGAAVPSPATFGSRPQSLGLQPPISYQWAAAGFVLMVAVVIATVLWVLLVTLPAQRRRAGGETDADYPGGRARDPRRARAIDTAIAGAGLTDHALRPFAVGWTVLAGCGAAATGLALSGIGPVQLADSGTRTAQVLSVLTNLGTYLISLSVLLLVLVGVQTYRNGRVRRTVGIIWDLATFWPRAAHPLAPPCYAERVVPELVHRATWLASEPPGVILSGHSQGSVLVAATVLQLPPRVRQRTALLTYGSPLRRIYARAFPTYFNDDVLAKMAAAVDGPIGSAPQHPTTSVAAPPAPRTAPDSPRRGPRWINLWRRTDPIGGPLGGQLADGDRRLPDPVSFDAPPHDRVAPGMRAHSGYQATDEFRAAVTELRERLSAGANTDGVSTGGVPARP